MFQGTLGISLTCSCPNPEELGFLLVWPCLNTRAPITVDEFARIDVHLDYDSLVFTTQTDYTLQSVQRCHWTEILGVEQERKRLVQIFEVLTTAQDYLIHKTLFGSITGVNRLILVSCQFSLLNSLYSCFSSPVYFKDTWSRSQLSKRFWSCFP